MSDQNRSSRRSELDSVRQVAIESGLSAPITSASVGISLDSADTIIRRATIDDVPRRPTPRRHGRAVRWAVATVAATTAVVVGMAPLLPNSKAEAVTPPVLDFEFAKAADIAFAPGKDPRPALLKIADVAGLGQQSSISEGSVQRVVSDNWFASIEDGRETTTVLIPTLSETRLSPDGALRLIERSGRPLAPDGRGLVAGTTTETRPTTADETQPAGTIDASLASNLPLSTDSLRSALLAESSCQEVDRSSVRTNCLFQQISSLFSTYVVSPQLASSLWKMLAEEAGVRLLGTVKDRAGRRGLGFSVLPSNEPTLRYVLVVDARSGKLLGTEKILVKNAPDLDVAAPAIMSFTAILDARFVRN